jgi:hypothetical protein
LNYRGANALNGCGIIQGAVPVPYTWPGSLWLRAGPQCPMAAHTGRTLLLLAHTTCASNATSSSPYVYDLRADTCVAGFMQALNACMHELRRDHATQRQGHIITSEIAPEGALTPGQTWITPGLQGSRGSTVPQCGNFPAASPNKTPVHRPLYLPTRSRATSS